MTIAVDEKGRRRLDLDDISRRFEADQQAERERANALAPKVEPEPSDSRLARLEEENEKMRAMITSALEARSRAREFMTIWSDPRKLPDLIQEIFIAHPNVVEIAKTSPEAARQAARLIAHLGVTYELHPLISGMIYAWIDNGKLYVEVGYRGYLEMIKRNTHLDVDGPREMTPEEKRLHGVGSEDHGGICFIHDWKRLERFTRRGLPAPQPHYGIGIWRKKNSRGKEDNVPASKGPQWVADKNALKDVARRVLDFSIVRTADLDIPELVYDDEGSLWTLPVPAAAWLKNPGIVKRFEALLNEHRVDEADFNVFIGHDWHYTMLEPDAIKSKLDDYLASRPQVMEGVFVDVPADPPAEAVAPEPEAPPAPVAAQPEPDPAPKEPEPVKKAPKVATCTNCGLDPADADGPYPNLCPKCASAKADADAARA